MMAVSGLPGAGAPMPDPAQRVKTFISAPGNEALTALYSAFAYDPRVSVQGVAPTPEVLVSQLPAAAVEVAIVDVELLVSLGESGIVQFLGEKHGGAALIVLLPIALEPMRARLQQLDRVRDVLIKPVNPAELVNRVWQIAQSERMMRAQVSPMASALATGWGSMAGGVPGARAVGSHVVAVTASKGGPGKTTIAVNLAYRLASLGVRTILIGFDTPDATGIQLGLRPVPNMGAWFRAPSREALQGAVQRKDGILDVLLSPNDLVHANQIEMAELVDRLAREVDALAAVQPGVRAGDLVRQAAVKAMQSSDGEGQIAKLVDEVRLIHPPYAALVLDLPPTQREWNIQPLTRATAVIVVAEPSRADQANVVHLLNVLTGVLDPRYRVPREALYLVLNRVTDRDPLTPQAFREGIEAQLGWAPPVIARIPHNPAVRDAQLRFVPPVTAVDDFRAGIDQIAAFLFPQQVVGGGGDGARKLKLGGLKIKLT